MVQPFSGRAGSFTDHVVCTDIEYISNRKSPDPVDFGDDDRESQY
jgi:hypothetical protein